MIRKKLQRIGNSIGLILPRDLIEAADLAEGDDVVITLHGRRMVVEPALHWTEDELFSKAYEAVLERHGEGFRLMAEYDRTGRRKRRGR